MSDQYTRLLFQQIEDRLLSQMPPVQIALLERLAAIEPCRMGCRGFENLGQNAVAGLTEAANITSARERRDFFRALIARLAQGTLQRAASMLLTPRILERTQSWLLQLAGFLESMEEIDYAFPSDWFCKDYRFVTLMTVPCGAQVVDLNDGVGPKTALKLALQHPLAALRAVKSPWFRPHTEGRYLEEFNELGWENCYREIAALLELHESIRGMAATSWFYDPVLSSISPRLAYLRKVPVENGAMLVRHATTNFDIQSATATSSTRRALYEAGEYQPVCCSILWDRIDIIDWAKKSIANV